MIESLAAEIARLNTLAVPEHTVPAGSTLQQSTSVPGSDVTAESLENKDDAPEGGTVQQLQQIDV